MVIMICDRRHLLKGPAFIIVVMSLLLGWAPLSLGLDLFQTVQITSSPNPVGSGARAQGMGGAFIAIADDATAASWNPGGLMQLERPEFSFAVSLAHRRKDFSSSLHPEASGINEIYREDLNYCSVAYPFMAFDKNMVVSLNYQRLYDFYDDLDFDFNYKGLMSDGSFFNVATRTRFRQSGAIKAFAPAWAIQLSPRFSFGMTFNFWTDNLGYDNEWEVNRTTTGTAVLHTVANRRITFKAISVYKERNENFEAFNMNLGFLCHVNRVVTLGAVLKTPFTADIDRKTYATSYSYPLGSPVRPPTPYRDRESIEMKFPMSYGIGVALRLSDVFTAGGDVYRTCWSNFWVRDRNGSTSPISGEPRRHSHVHDTTQVRLGCEYLWILQRTIVPLRLGLFYDPEPSEKSPEDYYGLSVGTGVMIGNVVLDCAYIYRFGRDVEGDAVGIAQTEADADQHSILVSMIYHF
jgi:long-subunit fatty acid transport protein